MNIVHTVKQIEQTISSYQAKVSAVCLFGLGLITWEL